MSRLARLACNACASVVLCLLATTPAIAAPLPVSALFAKPALLSPKVSPDGTKVAMIAQLEGKQFFATYDVATQQITPITRLDESRILNLIWKTDDIVLLVMQNTETMARVFRSFGLKTGDTRVHSFRSDTNAMILQHLLPEDPSSVLISFLARDHATGLYRVELKTDKMTLEQKDPPYDGRWIVSPDANTFCVLSSAKERSILQWRRKGDTEWKTIDLGPQSSPGLDPLGFHPDGVRVLAKKNSKADGPPDIVALDLATEGQQLILDSPTTQFDEFHNFEMGTPIHAMSYRDGRTRTQHINPETARLQASIDAVLPHTGNTILSLSRDQKVAVILAAGANHPGEYFLVDRKGGRLSSIGPRFPDLRPTPGVRLQNFAFQTRDGKTLQGRILLPPSTAKPPVLIYFSGAQLPHRKLIEWDTFAQLFATRGIAFAVFDVRGTRGYGDAFRKSGESQITTGMVSDARDGLEHLVREGLVDPTRIAVYTEGNHGVTGMYFISQEPRTKFWINSQSPMNIKFLDANGLLDAIESLNAADGPTLTEYDESVTPELALKQISVPALHVDLSGSEKRRVAAEIKKRKVPWTLIESPETKRVPKGKRAPQSSPLTDPTMERVLAFALEQFGLAPN